MPHLDKHVKEIQVQLGKWAEKAQQDYPHQLEASIRSAVDRLDPSAVAKASEEVVATVTGNRKTARHARKTIEKSLRAAQRKVGTQSTKKHETLFAIAAIAITIGLCWVVIRRATRTVEPPRGPDTRHAERDQGVDPDLGSPQ